MIKKDEILGFFDIDKLTVYKSNRKYLSKNEKKGKIISVTQKIPKSFIVCEKDLKNMIYISPLTPITLNKRLNSEGLNFDGGDSE